MNRLFRPALFASVVVLAFSLTGCAGARLNKGASSKPLPPKERIAQLESETQAKDQEIRRLQEELEGLRGQVAASESYSYEPATNVKASPATGAIRVPGLTVTQLQRALKSAGYDPGTIDGRLGKRTKEAVRSFQRAEGLKVDGVVGQKTWSALKRASA